MRTFKSLAILLAFGCYVPLALAGEYGSDDALVTIFSPANGAKLGQAEQVKISYEAVPGSEGDHAHLYVDDKQEAILRQLRGSHMLEALTPGKHEICIKVVTRGHAPIGVQQCIGVSVE